MTLLEIICTCMNDYCVLISLVKCAILCIVTYLRVRKNYITEKFERSRYKLTYKSAVFSFTCAGDSDIAVCVPVRSGHVV